MTPSHHFDQLYGESVVVHSLQNQGAQAVYPEGGRKQWSQELTLLAQHPEPGIPDTGRSVPTSTRLSPP